MTIRYGWLLLYLLMLGYAVGLIGGVLTGLALT